MKHLALFLSVLLWVMISDVALANEQQSQYQSFQTFFANMRHCLESEIYPECLSTMIAPVISRPADNYSKKEFISLITKDSEQRKHLKSCFKLNSKIIMSFENYVLFRSGTYACGVRKNKSGWFLTEFYNFFSEE